MYCKATVTLGKTVIGTAARPELLRPCAVAMQPIGHCNYLQLVPDSKTVCATSHQPGVMVFSKTIVLIVVK